ncbi:hypothetical protein NLG97_g2196 [Lecanicillium saksenae]|uniref:Uncharacterized protein n=1 Tax=Lecanicillium saksenae TaxID=468837 RepID=A0ACC1R281_9HYPO|nr:hypothetical protein NLG97_g2196 [Lecanicillium saksenae]
MPSASSWANGLVLALATHVSAAPASPSPDSIPGNFRYGPNTKDAVFSLNQNWYNKKTGLWGDLWWNSGNALTTIADFTQLSPVFSLPTDPYSIIENTFNEAQHVDVQTAKFMNFDNGGMMESHYCINGTGSCALKRDGSLEKRGFKNFLNNYYDDEGWWALALIRSYDVTYQQKYLDAAVAVFEDMQTGVGGPCNGGIYWSKDRTYVNAIANELYLSVAASLANRIPSESIYLQTAKDQWEWFSKSGMINSDNLINDGLTGDCKNNGQQTWSYNQGVILGGLVELFRATRDRSLLNTASNIAKAAIKKLSNKDGVLVETGDCEDQPGRCGQDGQQFKGVFIRNLAYLHRASPDSQFRSFILTNANSIWKNDRDTSSNKLGVAWAGPYYDATSPSHSSALDALVAAIAVA